MSTPHYGPSDSWVNNYDLGEYIGEGRHGTVWHARDKRLERGVVMKRLKQGESEASRCRFLAEAQITSQLAHLGILPIFDVGFDDDSLPFYTTQFFAQRRLHDVWCSFDRSRGALEDALRLLIAVCSVLSYAHQRGVIHRDVKLDNILVSDFGGMRLIDWGAAGIVPEKKDGFKEPFVTLGDGQVNSPYLQGLSGSSRPGAVIYTPPEIFSGQPEELRPETDIYAVGVMLYALLARRLPYSKPDGSLPEDSKLREAIVAGAPEPIRGLAHWVSRDLAAVAEKAMAHRVAGRYKSAQELADDIRHVLEFRPVTARPFSLGGRVIKWVRRNPILAVSAMTILAGAMTAAGLINRARLKEAAATQASEFHEGEVAARHGEWEKALTHWTAAEAAGFPDPAEIGLLKAEAWTVLGQSKKSADLLQALLKSPGSSNHIAEILVHWGEHELFDESTSPQGVIDLQRAIQMKPPGAQLKLAEGLLADSSLTALALCQESLKLDPFHYSAHRVSLSLEYLLGRHDELRSHLQVMSHLFPNDPSAIAIAAAELAADNHAAEAEKLLKALDGRVDPRPLERLRASFKFTTALQNQFRFEVLAGDREAEPVPFDSILIGTDIRVPRLPCLQKGMIDGTAAVANLRERSREAMARLAAQLTACASNHADSVLPIIAADLLERWKPSDGRPAITLLKTQMELFELAEQGFSNLSVLAAARHFLAARKELEFALTEAPGAAEARKRCLDRIRAAALEPMASSAECRAFLELAERAKDYTDAYAILWRWRALSPGDPLLPRKSIPIFAGAGDWSGVARAADELLTLNPNDEWAGRMKRLSMEQLSNLIKSTQKTAL